MIRKGRLARLATLGGMATGLVGDAARAGAHLAVGTAEEAAAELHRRGAERMLEVFADMKGLPLKAGQMLSYIDEFIPEEHRAVYAEVLGRLQAQTPPMDWEVIQGVLREEFDGRGPEEVFADFDDQPIAAASIGQVYRAVLHDGTEVVVKVQYPGVSEAIHSDLANAGVLVSTLSRLMPKTDFRLFLADLVRRVEEECDYAQELANQEEFRAIWAGREGIVVPRAFPGVSTGRVLVSEHLDGVSWGEMLQSATAEQQRAYGERIFQFVFESLFVHGIFNGDPHPGNYLFGGDGSVAFIDYGCVQRFDASMRAGFRELREVVLAGATGPEFRDVIWRVLAFDPDLDPAVADRLEDYLHRVMLPITAPQPFRFDRAYSKRLLDETMEIKAVVTMKMLRGKRAYPVDVERADAGVAFLGRIVFGLASILATLGAEADFREIVRAMG